MTLRLTSELFTGKWEDEVDVDAEADEADGKATDDEVGINDADAGADEISVENGSVDNGGTAEVSGVVKTGVDTGTYSVVDSGSFCDKTENTEP